MKYELLYEDINERALVCEIDAFCWQEFVMPLMGVRKISTIFVYEKGKAQAYFSEKDLKLESKGGLNFYKKKENLHKAIIIKKRARKESEEFNDLVRTTDLETIPQNELLFLLRKYFRIYLRTLGAHYLSQPQIFYDIETEILKEMEGLKDKDEKFITLTTPTKISALKKQEIELNELALKVAGKRIRKKTIVKVLKEIENKYGMYAAGQGHDKWEFQFYIKEIDKLVVLGKTTIKKNLERIKENQENLIRQQKELGKNIKFSEITKNLIRAARELGFYRLDYTRISWTSVWYYGTFILKEIAKRLDLSLKQVENCLLHELEDLLLGLIDPKEIQSELDKREEFFFYKLENRKPEIHSGMKGKKIRNKIIGIVDYESINELKGYIANKGRVEGIARVISNEDANLKRDIASFKEGEILIAQNTWPQFLPAMYKAKAIVTNEGGIASHAAIVSRELGKPCIVATKHGTKVFKTGDKVLVDANKGIIKRIK